MLSIEKEGSKMSESATVASSWNLDEFKYATGVPGAIGIWSGEFSATRDLTAGACSRGMASAVCLVDFSAIGDLTSGVCRGDFSVIVELMPGICS